MNDFMEKLEKVVAPIASGLSNNKIIQATSRGLMPLISVLMIGAFASILQALPIDAYQSLISSSGLYDVFGVVVNVTTNMVSLYAVFTITYVFTKNHNLDNDPLASGIISLLGFILVTPMTTEGEGWMAITNLPITYLGARGLFSAMIIAIFTGYVYNWLIDKKITIKMPESVPTFVSKSFAGIIPGVVLTIIYASLYMIFQATNFGSMHETIYTLIGIPLSNIGGSIWATLLIYLLSGLCWFFGIHGIAVISVILPVWLAADAANVAAVAAGQVPTNIITNNWVNAVGNIGGSGCTLALVVLMFFFAKSERYRTFSKVAIVPSLFNINEPVVFGLPCMLNPILAIPFIFTPVILITIAYGLTIVGILPVGNGAGAPSGFPILITGLFNLGIRGMIWQVVAFLISLGIYFPFFKVLDKQALEEEKTFAAESDNA